MYIFLLKLLNPSLVENKFDFVICSGSRTVFPGYLLARSSGAKILYIGTPKFRIMKKFDGIISTKTDIRGYFVNVIELRGPIQREHHHEIIENFQRVGLLKIISLSELHRSENKEFGDVKKFVEKERKDLRDQIYKLL